MGGWDGVTLLYKQGRGNLDDSSYRSRGRRSCIRRCTTSSKPLSCTCNGLNGEVLLQGEQIAIYHPNSRPLGVFDKSSFVSPTSRKDAMFKASLQYLPKVEVRNIRFLNPLPGFLPADEANDFPVFSSELRPSWTNDDDGEMGKWPSAAVPRDMNPPMTSGTWRAKLHSSRRRWAVGGEGWGSRCLKRRMENGMWRFWEFGRNHLFQATTGHRDIESLKLTRHEALERGEGRCGRWRGIWRRISWSK